MTEPQGERLAVLLVSPYHTGSHAQWAEGYAAASRHRVTLVTHEGQFWKWRLSGAAPTLAVAIREEIERSGPPDVLLATSMVDLAGLLGLLRGQMDVPIALYMHENQITYPVGGRTRQEHRLGLISWMSMLAADGVALNSEYHRNALFAELPAFLDEFPDRPHRGLIDHVAERCTVLPVGVDLRRIEAARGALSDPPLILWNHRWDPDKAPDEFLGLAGMLASERTDFQVALAGERFANQGAEFVDRIHALGDRVAMAEHLPDERYVAVLRSSDIVVSTARQENFGVSVVEAMHAGALPILPDRLVYPERVPDHLADRCLYRSPGHARELIGRALDDIDGTRSDAETLQQVTEGFDWSVVAPRYDDWLAAMTGS